ncbi:MAG: hypothetical protein Q9195_001640 [Heterodermia aff. obscurata]
MAEPPDPKTLESWEDAFRYPVAAVRGMERQLRVDIESNRERLRSLVGASYRDLLGTAESIIEMDGKMQEVEVHLGDIGARCNTRLLEKKISNLRQWDTAVGAVATERYMFASQFAVLKSCPEAMSRLLRESSSVLLAAKVLVISRLLHTKLSQRARPPPYLETIRNRLASLRRRLLAKIDKRMKSLDIARDALVDAMCAFSLATSSSPADVLRHFHHVRIEAISEQGRERSNSDENTLRAMRLYIGTLKDTRATIPTMLAQALESLKSIPLIKSQDLYTLVELNLDLHENRIEDDIRTFTPYIRLNDLQKPESEKHLKQWARRALSSLLDDLNKHLESFTDTLEVMELRKHMFELWFSSQHQCTGIEPSEVIDGLRNAFNLRWAEIIRTQSTSLRELGVTIRNTIEDRPSRTTLSSQSLWDSTVTSMDISHGGKAFRETLIATAQGSNDIKAVSQQYTNWLQSVENIEATIIRVQAMNWDDTGISIDDDDDDVLNDNQVLLSEDDPRLLREQCSDSVQQALRTLEESLKLVAEGLDEIRDGQKAILVLRIWRDIRQRMPQTYQRHDMGLTSIERLQKVAAKTVLWKPIQCCRKRIEKVARGDKVPGRPLWEGDPPLPVLPSPWAFRLLREIMSSMAEAGSDIWSAQTTDTLKKELRQLLVASFEGLKLRTSFSNGHPAETAGSGEDSQQQILRSDSVESSTARMENGSPAHNAMTNGDLPEAHAEGKSLECRTQEVFDLAYLSHATTLKQSEHNDDEDAFLTLLSKTETELDVEQDSIHRLKKSAENYWKRTSLMFALLA